jgi:hypothetical protein
MNWLRKLWWTIRYGRAFALWYEELRDEALLAGGPEYVATMNTARWWQQYKSPDIWQRWTRCGRLDFYPYQRPERTP